MTVNKPWVVAIIGGGPAACATALSLCHALRESPQKPATPVQIHLYDAASHTGQRVGETIPPAATPILRKLAVADIVEKGGAHLECPGSISLWDDDSPGHNDFFLDLVGKGYHLDRALFDQQMRTRAESAGAQLHSGWRLKKVQQQQAGFQLQFDAENTTERICADYVVDASGKGSAFSRRLPIARNVFDEVLFICAYVDQPKTSCVQAHTLVEAVADGWWYAAGLPQGKTIITFCTDLQNMKENGYDSAEKWLGAFEATTWLKSHFARPLEHNGEAVLDLSLHTAPSSLLSAVSGKNWLAVGDAASCYDPITSAGITKAMMHGEQAGRAIAQLHIYDNDHALREYSEQVLADFNRYAGLRHALYNNKKWVADNGFWMGRVSIALKNVHSI